MRILMGFLSLIVVSLLGLYVRAESPPAPSHGEVSLGDMAPDPNLQLHKKPPSRSKRSPNRSLAGYEKNNRPGGERHEAVSENGRDEGKIELSSEAPSPESK